MNFKARIEELCSQISGLESQSNDLLDQANDARIERDQLITSTIFEHKMFANTYWNLRLDGLNKVELVSKKEQTETSYKNLCAIAKLINAPQWDVVLDLGDGIELWIETDIEESIQKPGPDDFTLRFKDNKSAAAFIKKQYLNIDASGITNRLDELKRTVSSLEKICHQFNKNGG